MSEEEIYSALIFKIQQGKEIATFTEEFSNCLKKAINPKIFIVIGKKGEYKNSFLNYILLDKSNNLPKNLILSSPFKCKEEESSLAKELLFYGPIKASEILRRNKSVFNEKEDFDCFFIDSEGIGNLYQMNKNFYHGILSLESIANCILFFSKGIINQEEISFISRHIHVNKLFNSIADNSFPSLGVIERNFGLENYKYDENEKEEKINSQEELKERLSQNSGIKLTDKNIRYITESSLGVPHLFINSLKELCDFIISTSKTKNIRNPELIINKFNQHEKIINKYPTLLDNDIPIEETLKNIFLLELQEASNKIKQEWEDLIINKINSTKIYELKKEKYLKEILLEIENKFENEANSRCKGMKNNFETQYNSTLLDLKNYFKLLIENKINEKMILFINQIKSYIEDAKNESEIDIEKSLTAKIEKLTSQQLRYLNNEKFINSNFPIEIQKFEEKVNSKLENIKNIPQAKDLYILTIESIKNFIRVKIKEKMNLKFDSCPPWPKNVDELLKEQKLDKLVP